MNVDYHGPAFPVPAPAAQGHGGVTKMEYLTAIILSGKMASRPTNVEINTVVEESFEAAKELIRTAAQMKEADDNAVLGEDIHEQMEAIADSAGKKISEEQARALMRATEKTAEAIEKTLPNLEKLREQTGVETQDIMEAPVTEYGYIEAFAYADGIVVDYTHKGQEYNKTIPGGDAEKLLGDDDYVIGHVKATLIIDPADPITITVLR